ncbi:MAG: ATP-dependent protease ATPase subunit HslU [Acidobacteriota bacterium]|nr:ATP-dependent protease ATPase subunit HslU [Acidobacteriota bacterium]
MVFYMPGRSGSSPLDEASRAPLVDSLTPPEVVSELDRFIVGQTDAKRAVAIALRNRWRRRQLPAPLADEVLPKNILMIGPTGVGKTEIARRLARLTGSPFLKIEATKYTEVGYVGRDCESMIRDLVELSLEMLRQQKRQEIGQAAARSVEDRLLEALAAPHAPGFGSEPARERVEAREKLRARLRSGELEEEIVEIELSESAPPAFKIAGGPGMEEIDVRLGEMMPGMFGSRSRKRRMKVAEARPLLQAEEEERRLDRQDLAREAIARTEQSGIVFLDELDKIAGAQSGHGPDVSRQGVQRDLLPIVEGTIVQTKHGQVRTDHILFIAAGAFHVAKPSDLIPEMQGRFPIRVELDRLDKNDFERILREPENSLIKQYQALLEVDGVELQLTEAAVTEIATLADDVNRRTEDIGARRLATVLERLLEPVLFDAPLKVNGRVVIDAPDVRSILDAVYQQQDLARYVL